MAQVLYHRDDIADDGPVPLGPGPGRPRKRPAVGPKRRPGRPKKTFADSQASSAEDPFADSQASSTVLNLKP